MEGVDLTPFSLPAISTELQSISSFSSSTQACRIYTEKAELPSFSPQEMIEAIQNTLHLIMQRSSLSTPTPTPTPECNSPPPCDVDVDVDVDAKDNDNVNADVETPIPRFISLTRSLLLLLQTAEADPTDTLPLLLQSIVQSLQPSIQQWIFSIKLGEGEEEELKIILEVMIAFCRCTLLIEVMRILVICLSMMMIMIFRDF